jgi:hypothetical protein
MMFRFESEIVLFILFLSLFLLENHICLSHDVHVSGVAWWTATGIVTEVEDLMQRIENGCTSQVLSGRTIRRSGDVVCDLHRAHRDEEHEFLS